MGKDKPRLGRGLSSLMTPSSEPSPDRTSRSTRQAERPASSRTESVGVDALARYVAVDTIDPNPYQPRGEYEAEALNELVASIREHGVVQPIVVRPAGPRYQLIAGQRRLEAAQRAELDHIPAIVRHADDREVLEVALIENIHREDLNPVDRALAYKRYRDSFDVGPEAIADRLGQDRTTVVNYLRLLSLPNDVLDMLRAGKLSMGHARALAGLENASAVLKLAAKIVKESLSVRQTEKLTSEHKSPAPPKPKPPKPANIADLEQQMTRALGTRVQIKTGRKKDTGKVIVEFYSLDDFERVLDRICPDREEL